jgi:DNA invertase Pin-like site-specific DNA recombinase
MNGLAFDLSTPHGRMMATIIAGIAEFERELRTPMTSRSDRRPLAPR